MFIAIVTVVSRIHNKNLEFAHFSLLGEAHHQKSVRSLDVLLGDKVGQLAVRDRKLRALDVVRHLSPKNFEMVCLPGLASCSG